VTRRAKTTTEQGYGWKHQQERARWQRIIDAGNGRCWRCGKRIPPRTPSAWDLGHHDHDRSITIGPECRSENRSVGARKGNAMRRTTRLRW
jgi:hypothetical protein